MQFATTAATQTRPHSAVPSTSPNSTQHGAHEPGAPHAGHDTSREHRPQRTRGSGRGAAPAGTDHGVAKGAQAVSSSPPADVSTSGPGDATIDSAAAAAAAAAGSTPGRSRASARATSANHLLNFQGYSNSNRAVSGGARGAPSGGRRGTGGASGSRGSRAQGGGKPQRYDRNQFLQANFRFLVSDAVESSRFCANPDLMFEWDDVVQVEMMTTAPVQCSISLDTPPICPQITPCGHVFSFASIMQHLMMHGGKSLRCSAPCPLCFSPLVARELRLLHVRPVGVSSIGAPQTFQLLKRDKSSILPQPVWRPGPGALPCSPSAAAGAAGTSTGSQGAAGGGARRPSGTGVFTMGASAEALHAQQGDGAPTLASPSAPVTGPAAPAAASVPSMGPHGLQGNVFAKFALTGDAAPLWTEAARELAAYAAEVTAEGGLEAAYLAPSIYGALDSLAARARRWTERRAEQLLERGLLAQAQGAGEVERLGAEAEAVVRAVFTAPAPKQATGSNQNKGPGSAAPGPASSPPSAPHDPFPALAPAQPRPAPTPFTPSTPPARPSVRADQQQQQQPLGKAQGNAPRQQQQQQQPQGRPAADEKSQAAWEQGEDGLEEEERQRQSASLGGEFRFEAAFSDDEPIDDEQEANADGQGGAGGSPRAEGGSRRSSDKGEEGTGGGAGGGGGKARGGAGPEALMGTSPTTTMMNAPNQRDEYFMYQAADGTWVFLHPLNLRCLLAHYGTYEACPATLQAAVLEMEDVVQSEATRKRWRFLAHLPSTVTFKLAEVDLSGLLPPAALAPFAEELGARERRRKRRAAQSRRAAQKEAADARAAEAAKKGPSVQELRAMPLPSASRAGSLANAPAQLSAARSASSTEDSRELQAAIEASLSTQSLGQGEGSSGGGGGAWAHLVKMGFAATGPTLGSSPPSSSSAAMGPGQGLGQGAVVQGGFVVLGAPAAPQPTGAWANKTGAIASAAKPAGASAVPVVAGWGARPGGSAAAGGVSRPGAPATGPQAAGDAGAEAGGKGKGKKGTLLFTTTAQRRY